MWKKAISKKGFKVGDRLHFVTSDGRSVKFKLNRKIVKIILKKGAMSDFSSGTITLPAINEEGEYQIFWDEEAQCFKLESLLDTPFVQNRTYSTVSFLLAGDEIFFDYNKVTAMEKDGKGSRMEVKLEYRWPQGISFLLEGETGTGKSTLARKLHRQYVGEEAPFIAVNLSSFNPSLIESELFGHEKGAFTGAIREKKGAVELANGGTLFLDEMDSLELSMQVKLLTFLDDLTFRRVGGEKSLRTDCRLIFAAGRSLKERVLSGDFRADLLYRIQSGLVERLPSLRENPSLIRAELLSYCEVNGIFIGKELAQYYETCLWPGNFRQLRSHLKRKEILHYGSRRLNLCPLDYELEKTDLSSHEGQTLEAVKKNHCHKIFLESQGNYALAARKLKIAKNTLKKMVA